MFYVKLEEPRGPAVAQQQQADEFLINKSIAEIQENALELRGCQVGEGEDSSEESTSGSPPKQSHESVHNQIKSSTSSLPDRGEQSGNNSEGVRNLSECSSSQSNSASQLGQHAGQLSSVSLVTQAGLMLAGSGSDLNHRDEELESLQEVEEEDDELFMTVSQPGLKSDTLRSCRTADYDTPPESPNPNSSGSGSLNSTLSRKDVTPTPSSQRILEKSASMFVDPEYPVRPPRTKKGKKVRLKSLDLQDSSHQNDLLFRTTDFELRKNKQELKGPVNVLTVTTGGLRQQWKERYAEYDYKDCRLRIYKNSQDLEKSEQDIDVLSATFNYILENSTSGEFTMCTKDGEFTLDVGTNENRQYWLQQLQRARREYTQNNGSNNRLMARSAIGLLREKFVQPEESKENSPYRDLMVCIDRPPDPVSIMAPKSADYNMKKSFFPSFARKPSFKLARSSSDRTPSPVGAEPRSPPPSKPSPTHLQGFQALSKIRKSLREKKPPLGPLIKQNSLAGRKPEDIAKELESVRDDLNASQEDATACRDVITVLQTQIKSLQKELETLKSLNSGTDGDLLDILREKDRQLLEAESQSVQTQGNMDQLQERISKLESEAGTYLQLLEAKDKSIVKLTNSLHEIELQDKIAQVTPPLTNGMTFFYAEKVAVGTQTDADKVKEALEDTVTAYEMQNRFLNKEVLELNQLRQQAIDREQKLFIEASDWEAKFYQIQSKYLLLLNELHNPQVMVSASRQEMVGHLLKDIVDNSERPSLNSHSIECDRFGFRLCEESGLSLEERAERLKKHAENLDSVSEEESKKKWDSVLASLDCPDTLTITPDMKTLIRRGIPINLRGSVWKAIVDKGVRGKLQPDYYQALLSNYNPGPQMCPAAKQIELDLLRTLPSNKHYESPHSSGIPKLRRVLLAYSLHNPEVEYCQGFNRIAAIALLFMNEEDAFWCLVYIVEQLMPSLYYCKQLVGVQVDQAVFKELVCEKLPDLAIHLELPEVEYCQGFNRIAAIALLFMNEEDAFWCLVYIVEQLMPSLYYCKQLVGVQVDQAVFKELVCEKLPDLAIHLESHGVDPALFSINWFLCLFVDSLPVNTYLHIWDSFLFEGSKVLFRYALAILQYMEDKLMKQTDYMSIFNTFRTEVESLTDVNALRTIAFETFKLSIKVIKDKRERHHKLIKAQMESLDVIRQDYRKNSINKPGSSCTVQSDEE